MLCPVLTSNHIFLGFCSGAHEPPFDVFSNRDHFDFEFLCVLARASQSRNEWRYFLSYTSGIGGWEDCWGSSQTPGNTILVWGLVEAADAIGGGSIITKQPLPRSMSGSALGVVGFVAIAAALSRELLVVGEFRGCCSKHGGGSHSL